MPFQVSGSDEASHMNICEACCTFVPTLILFSAMKMSLLFFLSLLFSVFLITQRKNAILGIQNTLDRYLNIFITQKIGHQDLSLGCFLSPPFFSFKATGIVWAEGDDVQWRSLAHIRTSLVFGLLFLSNHRLIDCDKSWLYKSFSLPPSSAALISTSPWSSWEAQMASPFVCKPQIELWLSWWPPLSYSHAPRSHHKKGPVSKLIYMY